MIGLPGVAPRTDSGSPSGSVSLLSTPLAAMMFSAASSVVAYPTWTVGSATALGGVPGMI